ncbi:MAG: hypothetical protein GY953_30150, partial [bacterium]|nr:hypothetical protein [bacterium]
HGLRISFIVGGPFSAEGVEKGYFLKENGEAKIFEINWPKSPCYLLDAHNPEAVRWYLGLVRKWTDYGVDGFKEDLYGYHKYRLRDDKIDPVNAAQMRAGQYVMGRNAYIGSPADLHRIDDFNHNQNQDRGPINSAAIAYSGFPLVYPDIVGGTFAQRLFNITPTPRLRTYIMRNAQWASVHPSMSMGQPPWTFDDPKVEQVILKAAQLHDRLHPYFYSQAVRWHRDGYPWPFAPLPVAFPDDPRVHGRENATVRGYQWMIGDALLAVPLYGDDYETAQSRDIYLPAGNWMDYDTGDEYEGPQLLKSFLLPAGKTPLFVGGAGIVIERRGEALVCRVYPVADRAETMFWHRDAKTASRIRVEVADWDAPKVSEAATGREVEAQRHHYAWEFPLEGGTDYEVR